MIGEIDRGRFVRFCLIGDLQFVIVIQSVDNCSFEIAGKALFRIFAEIGKFDRGTITGGNWLRFPNVFIEAAIATMQCVLSMVLRNSNFFSIENKLGVAYAIGESSDDCPE